MRGASATALLFWSWAPPRLQGLALLLLALHVREAARLTEVIHPAFSSCILAWWAVQHAAVVVVVLAAGQKEAWARPGPFEADPRLAAPRPPEVVSAPSKGSSSGHVCVCRLGVSIGGGGRW